MVNNMDIQIVNFMKKYDISDLEIQDLSNNAPMLKYSTYNEFIANCKLLVDYGYPKEDLDILLLANPKIFARAYSNLEKDLIFLSDKYEDIEMILKQNPTII